jgi:methionyl-tRNA synthetase
VSISYDDFKKVELKIAKILEAEEVPGAEKLLRLQIDLGNSETRQIVAGIKKMYDAKSLIGKEIAVVVNLEPRMVMGIESNGMLLAASSDAGPVILMPEREVAPGSGIK